MTKNQINIPKPKQNKGSSLSKSFYTKLFIVFGLVLVLFALYNVIQVFTLGDQVETKIAYAKELARPAEIQLITIKTDDCKECFDTKTIIDVIMSTGINLTSEKVMDYSSAEAKSLIQKFGVQKLPTVIITGELDKAKSLRSKLKDLTEEKEGVLVFTAIIPPFIDSTSGKVSGKISLTQLVKPDCKDCLNTDMVVEQIKKAGVSFKKIEKFSMDSIEGKELISKYNIKKIPSIIMDKELDAYPGLKQSVEPLGSFESDGSFIMRMISPPYFSVEENGLKGVVKTTYLSDNSCKECYNVTLYHKQILQKLGVFYSEDVENDISNEEGQFLIEKYSIENVPTIVISGDMEEYPTFIQAWSQVGSVEEDGTFVFRNLDAIQQVYRNLLTNEIMKAGNPIESSNT